jgi:hypothetical protein
MPIWKLAPIATAASDNAWAFSRWFGPILVRAKNPKQARKIAAEGLGKPRAGERDTNKTSLISPWLNDGLVACSRVAVSTYRPEGPDQILQPHVSEYGRA